MSDIYTVYKRIIIRTRIIWFILSLLSLIAFVACSLLTNYGAEKGDDICYTIFFSLGIIMIVNIVVSFMTATFSFISNTHQYLIMGQVVTVFSGLIKIKIFIDEDNVISSIHGWDLAKPKIFKLNLRNGDELKVRVNKSGKVIVKWRDEIIKPIDGNKNKAR